MLYRVQAPERSATPSRPPPRPASTGDGAEGAATPGTNTALPAEPAEPSYSISERIVSAFASNPLIRCKHEAVFSRERMVADALQGWRCSRSSA